MKIARRDDSMLRVVDFPIDVGVASSIFVVFALMALIHDVVSGVYSTQRLLGISACAITGLLVAAFFIKRSIFEFDRQRQLLMWRRGGLFGAKSGRVPFDRIRSATVESITGDGSALRYRTAVVTNEGTLPITEYYTLGAGERCEQMRDEINRIVHPGAPSTVENDIREMARDEHSVRAVAMAKQKLGLSTSDAVRFVSDASGDDRK
jgi:hypothetical protein